jgi:uncharacterized protein with FMN-binding domain
MKFFTRASILALAAATFFSAVAIGPAEAFQWFFSQTPDLTATPPAIDNAAPTQLAANARRYRDGSFLGSPYDAYYGLVQVQANIQGGRLISVDVLQFPNHRSTSRAINRQALPMLESEVVSAQGIRVNMISGATLTSDAYLRSLRGALKQAGT